MSFSVDDLVSSLSSNHIGQEAIDLATLQAQLAQTLVCGSSSSSYNTSNTRTRQFSLSTHGHSQHTQPCNTPIARTPSSSSYSFSHAWGMDTTPHSRARANSVSSTYLDETEEDDERMVEDLLIPLSAPLSAANATDSQLGQGFPSSSSFAFQTTTPTTPTLYQINTNQLPSCNSEPTPSSPTTSLFATTDPFYIAQLQAASQQQSQSVFAQNGRLTQNSPFALPTQYHQFHAQNQWEGVGARNMNSMPATTCAAAF